ncbi:nucleotide exchange factor GrpE [Dactylosporangium sp. CA-092794]|uniref:nucleotide exchange factor GrpE n=1 Tax=Dactylosporangium sp. CA-092794 TaxID=3239929 RepID=UPI003D913F00
MDAPDEPAEQVPAAEADEWRERWQRAAAEVENTRKRCDRLVAERTAAERQRVAAEFLPMLDHLDLALRHAGADPQAIVAGVTQVREEAQAVLRRLGFAPVGAEGEAFDPSRHEAAEAVADPAAPPGTVVRVVRPGYGGPAGLLRPAVVAVAATPSSAAEQRPATAEEHHDDGG